MEFMILDSSGSAVASFADDLAARAAIHAIVAVEPTAADHVVLLAYDDDGMPVGDALAVWDVPSAVTVEASEFVAPQVTRPFLARDSRATTRYFGGAVATGWQPRVDAVPA